MSQLASGFSSANLRSFFSPNAKISGRLLNGKRVFLPDRNIVRVQIQTPPKNLRVPFQEDGVAKNKRQKTDGRRLRLHGNFTPAHADGCGARCFAGVQCASLIILSARPRPQAATPVLRPNEDRSLVMGSPKSQRLFGESRSSEMSELSRLRGSGRMCSLLRRGHGRTGRPARRRQIVSVCLILRRRLPRRAFFVKELYRGAAWKGEHAATRPWVSSDQSPGWR